MNRNSNHKAVERAGDEKPGWWKRMTVRLAQVDQHIRGERWRWLVRWLYRLMAPFYDWGADRLMPDYRQAAVQLLDDLAVAHDDVVLDLGCGTGMVTVPARDRARFTAGIDMTLAMVRQLREKQVNGQPAAICGQALRLPFASQSFSAVTTSFMLLHLTAAEKQQVFREARRVLKVGGRFGCLTGRHETGSAYPTPDEWRSSLEQNGFSNVESVAYGDVYTLIRAERIAASRPDHTTSHEHA